MEQKGTSGNTHHNVTDRRPRRRTSRDVITTSVIAHLHTDVSLTVKLTEVFVIFTVMCEQQEGLDSSFTNSAETFALLCRDVCRTGYLAAITALSQKGMRNENKVKGLEASVVAEACAKTMRVGELLQKTQSDNLSLLWDWN